MSLFSITSKSNGADYGDYEGETKEDAARAMLADAGCDDEPEMDNFLITEI